MAATIYSDWPSAPGTGPRPTAGFDDEVARRAETLRSARVAPPAAATPQPTTVGPTVKPPGTLRNAYNFAVGAAPTGPQRPDTAWGAAKKAAVGGGSTAPILGAVSAAADEVPKIADSLRDPNTTGIDSATQVAESTAKVAARGAGVGIGAKLGGAGGMALGAMTGPAAPVAVPVLGTLGAAAGGYLGDRLAGAATDAAITGGRNALGVSAPPTSGAPGRAAGLSPEQQRSRDIINNPTQRGVFTPAQQAAARSELDTLRNPTTNITRVGNSYGGPDNISGNITVNGKAPGGSVNTMSAANFVQAAPSVQAQLASLRAEAADNTSFFSGRRGDLGGNQNATVMSGQTYGVLGQSGAGEMFKQQRGETGRNYRARMASMQSEAASLRGDATTRRGQDLTQETDIRRDGTTRRGQDMDLQGRIMPKQMELEQAARMRQATAAIWEKSGGDPQKAAAIAQSVGLDGKSFLDTAKAQRELTDGARAASDKQFEHRAVTTDEKGNLVINNAVAATSRNVREQLAPGYDAMTPQEQGAARPYLDAGMNLVEGMNRRREDTLWKYLGLDDAPTLSTLPDLRGARDESVGWWEGMTTPNVQRGDRKITLRDGTERYVPKDTFNENERALLRDMK